MRLSPLRALWAGHVIDTNSQAATPEQAASGSNSVISGREYTNPSIAPAAFGNYSIYDKLPGLWFETCLNSAGHPPCTAYCRQNDTLCQEVGKEVVSSCNDIWSTYNGDKLRSNDPASGWSTVYTTYGQSAGPSTTTVKIYTSFSTANVSVIKQNKNPTATGMVTITPVYAMGNPVDSISITTLSGWTEKNSWLTAPLPSCRYIDLSTTNNCGQCAIYGGTVGLYFWPPATATSSQLSLTASITTEPASLVLSEGVTLYLPTVYISLTTVYARNSCSFIGKNHTGTLIPMNPAEVSTQVHIGGKVAATGAYYYGQVNYADLMGVPPVSDYENQPSCLMFGCPTIYPTYRPTLVVPMALRSLNPEWNTCVSALVGLYDPPIALTAAATAASVTDPFSSSSNAAETTQLPVVITGGASQCSIPVAPTPTATYGPTKSTIVSPNDQIVSMPIGECATAKSTQQVASDNALGVLLSALTSKLGLQPSPTMANQLPSEAMEISRMPDSAYVVTASLLVPANSQAGAAVTVSAKNSRTVNGIVIPDTTAISQYSSSALVVAGQAFNATTSIDFTAESQPTAPVMTTARGGTMLQLESMTETSVDAAQASSTVLIMDLSASSFPVTLGPLTLSSDLAVSTFQHTSADNSTTAIINITETSMSIDNLTAITATTARTRVLVQTADTVQASSDKPDTSGAIRISTFCWQVLAFGVLFYSLP